MYKSLQSDLEGWRWIYPLGTPIQSLYYKQSIQTDLLYQRFSNTPSDDFSEYYFKWSD